MTMWRSVEPAADAQWPVTEGDVLAAQRLPAWHEYARTLGRTGHA